MRALGACIATKLVIVGASIIVPLEAFARITAPASVHVLSDHLKC
jgi:hypothetical protein